MPTRPSGTVTLLFTDIEGSTRLLQRLGPDYRDVLHTHRRLLRDAWSAHGGVEIDTEGDSFFVAFQRAADAVAAAIQAQRALASEPWPDDVHLRVRIGIHTGEPELAGGDYVGIDVHRAARIMAAGHGGQVLVSQAAVLLLPSDLPDGATLVDLGDYALKDLARPEHLYQVTIPGLESAFPALRSAPGGRSNLPTAPTPLVGRGDEVAAVTAILAEGARLLTLTGPGGTGKTRLALEVAAGSGEAFGDGIYLVDLSALDDAELVLPAIARTLPLGERPADPLDEWLAARLDGRRMLVLLDNFEQVMGAASQVSAVLAGADGPTCLVTSREPLRIAAERTYPVPPLDGSGAEALFVERARAVRPDFEVDEANAAAVAAICGLVDGLPLAIELAAPWVRVLEPAAIAERLGEGLDLLADRSRELPERQRTLRGAIDWSYRLLDEDERTLFRQLGIFAGGWTLAAAEQVCDREGVDLLFALGSLIDKNLIRREPGEGGDGRFSMLESIRPYARERLDESGDLDAVAARHAEWYARLAEQAGPELYGPAQTIQLGRLSADLENLRGAARWTAGSPDRAQTGLRLVGALALFWFLRGRYREGFDLTERILLVGVDATPAVRVKALLAAGLLGVFVADPSVAAERLEQALAIARALGDTTSEARCLDFLGLLTFFRDDIDAARRRFEESSVIARRDGDLWCLADALGTLASILPLQGAFDASDAAADEALAIARRADDPQGVRMALFAQALGSMRRGDLERTRSTGEEGLAVARSIGDVWFVAYFQWLLALERVETGDLARARTYADDGLEVARGVGAPLLLVCALEARAAVARREGRKAAAAADLEEARGLGGGGVPRSYLSAVTRALGVLAHERGDDEAARSLLDEAIGLAREVDDPWAENAARLGLATIERDPAAARSLAAAALEIASEMGARLQAAEARSLGGAIEDPGDTT